MSVHTASAYSAQNHADRRAGSSRGPPPRSTVVAPSTTEPTASGRGGARDRRGHHERHRHGHALRARDRVARPTARSGRAPRGRRPRCGRASHPWETLHRCDANAAQRPFHLPNGGSDRAEDHPCGRGRRSLRRPTTPAAGALLRSSPSINDHRRRTPMKPPPPARRRRRRRPRHRRPLAGAGSAQTPPTTLHSRQHVPERRRLLARGRAAPGRPPRLRRHGHRRRHGPRPRRLHRHRQAQLLCTIQVQLSKGTLTAQGMLPRALEQDAGRGHRRHRRLRGRARHRPGRPTRAGRPTWTSRCCPEPGEELGERDGRRELLGPRLPLVVEPAHQRDLAVGDLEAR